MELAATGHGSWEERFDVRRKLGEGTFGVVHEAIDRLYGSPVALKVLRVVQPDTLYQLKREFRALADVGHPNLVTYYELIGDAERWCISMELLHGADFLTHVRPATATATAQRPAATVRVASRRGAGSPPRPPRVLQPDEEQRLRAALAQLAVGVQALHELGIVHQDLKPSNVLVTATGRVVLLDFGLAESFAGGDQWAPGELAMGTPAYMAPERWAQRRGSEASDWYSVGVMLREALTGELDPHEEGALPAGPADLAELCRDLLRREADGRPAGPAILARLGVAATREMVVRRRPSPERLVGREAELSSLDAALEAARGGRSVVVRVAGPSGIGKTSLVKAFLDGLEERGAAVVLRGRCHGRESVPFNAFDGVVDALARHLLSLPAAERAAVPGLGAIAGIFPVLEEAGRALATPATEQPTDPQRLRREAFAELKELLRRLGAHAPLLLHIDDAHWADDDSLRLLEELVAPPAPLSLLLLLSTRDEGVEELDAALRGVAAHAEVRSIVLGRLSPEAAVELGRRCGARLGLEAAERIARESEGVPYFIEQLALSWDGADGAAAAERPTLDELVGRRLAALPDGARGLLEVAALAARPLGLGVVMEAASLGPSSLPALALLASASLLRSGGGRAEPIVELYHHRIGRAVVERLDASGLAARHLRLAGAYAAAPDPDPEVLAHHFHEGGEADTAARHAVTAGDRAAQALAFARAADLYAKALGWSQRFGADERHSLEVRRATALARAGRGAAAGPLFLAAAAGREPAEALDLRRRSAEQYLLSGCIDDGVKVLAPLLDEVGLSFPRGRFATLARIVFLLLPLSLRKPRFRERPAGEISTGDLTRIDLCWAASQGMSDVDPLASAYFQLQFVRLALGSGERARASRGLVGLGAMWVARGTASSLRQGSELIERGEAVARGLDDPSLQAFIALCQATRCLVNGDWEGALELNEPAIRLLRERCVGEVHYVNLAQSVSLIALERLGRYGESAERSALWARESAELGDRFGQLTATLFRAPGRLAADDPAGARALVRSVIASWSTRGFHVQHLYSLRMEAYADLYEGDGAAALARVREAWPAIERSGLLQVQFGRFDARILRARAALGAAAAAPDSPAARALLKDAEVQARHLARELRRDAVPVAALLHGAIARLRGDHDAAHAALDRAVAGFEAARMPLYAACARCYKQIFGSADEGDVRVLPAEGVLSQVGITAPRRWLRMVGPGWLE